MPGTTAGCTITFGGAPALNDGISKAKTETICLDIPIVYRRGAGFSGQGTEAIARRSRVSATLEEILFVIRVFNGQVNDECQQRDNPKNGDSEHFPSLARHALQNTRLA